MADKQNPLDDMTKFMGQFKLPGVDMAAIIEARRKDIEALVEAGCALASMQALGAKQTEMFKEAMQRIQESAKAGLTGAAIGDPAKQAEIVRKACERAIADMKDLAEMTRKSQADAMAHITQRATEHMGEIRKLMQPK
jgi:phasin family protein